MYASVEDLRLEIDLIWQNAVMFNGADSSVGKQVLDFVA